MKMRYVSVVVLVALVVSFFPLGAPTASATIANGQADLILGDASYGGSTGDGTQFSAPYGVSVDAAGNVYITDSFLQMVKKYTSNGVFVRSFFGEHGNGNGQFNQVFCTAIASNGDIYVTDQGNNRIQKFDSTGQYLSMLSGFGYLGDISVDASDNLFVADSMNHQIKKYSPSGTLLMTFGSNGSGAGQFNWPTDVAVDANGSIFVAEMNNNRVQKFTSTGTLDTSYGNGGIAGVGVLSHPNGLGIDTSGNLYVTDVDHSRIVKFNPSGSVVGQVGTYGSGDGQLATPYALAVSADNKIYVTENGNSRVSVFDSNLTFIRKIGSGGLANGQFRSPRDTVVDAAGTIYVADSQNNRIQYFSAAGTYLGNLQSGTGSWNDPVGMTIDQSGKLYVLEGMGTRLQIFDSNRQFIRSFSISGGMMNIPQSVAVDASGNIYITISGFMFSSTVKKYDSNGTLQLTWGSYGSGNGQFYSISAIAIDQSGNVLIADPSLNRIQKFSPTGTYISQFGTSGTGAGQLSYAQDIVLDATGNIYVSELNTSRISVFDSTYTFIRSIGSGGFGQNQFRRPSGLFISANGDLYVADVEANRVSRFNLLSAPSPSPTVVRPIEAMVSVNGGSKPIGTLTNVQENNKSIMTIGVNTSKVLESIDQSNKLVIPSQYSNQTDSSVSLTGEAVKLMEGKGAVLDIQTSQVSYVLPAAEINIDAVSSQIGSNVSLANIQVKVNVVSASSDAVMKLDDAASKGQFAVVAPPVAFTVNCTAGGKTVEVSKFNSYVERTVAIPEGIDPSKVITGVVLNGNGTISPIPTKVILEGGKYFAKINSLTNSTYAVVQYDKTFSDMTGHWAGDAVKALAGRFVVSGREGGTFDPEASVTRGEFAMMMTKALGIYRTVEGKERFADVGVSNPYHAAVNLAAEYGLIKGYAEDGTFRPDGLITREETMAILNRALKLVKVKDAAAVDVSQFADAGSLAAWAKDDAVAIVGRGIMTAFGGKLYPQRNLSRAEAAATLWRVLKRAELID